MAPSRPEIVFGSRISSGPAAYGPGTTSLASSKLFVPEISQLRRRHLLTEVGRTQISMICRND